MKCMLRFFPKLKRQKCSEVLVFSELVNISKSFLEREKCSGLSLCGQTENMFLFWWI